MNMHTGEVGEKDVLGRLFPFGSSDLNVSLSAAVFLNDHQSSDSVLHRSETAICKSTTSWRTYPAASPAMKRENEITLNFEVCNHEYAYR